MRWLLRSLFGIIALIVAAALYLPVPTRYDLTLRGQVIDENGKPIPGAIIGSQIENRCGSLGGGSTTAPFAFFRTKANDNGQFEHHVKGLFWGHASILTLSGCGPVEDRFVCSGGFAPMLQFNYLHPESTPQKGTFDVTYTLRREPPTQALGISFLRLAQDALQCSEQGTTGGGW